MELVVKNIGNKTTDKVTVSETVFGCEYNEDLIHQVVVSYQANGRQNTKGLKNRSAVSGGGSKPWRQKGTGRARAGTSRGPLWRTGGVTFDQPKQFNLKVNKKMYRGAMRSILSTLVKQDRLIAVSELSVASPKTKELVAKLKQLDLEKVLIVSDKVDENLYLSARNLSNVSVVDVDAVDPVSLVGFEKVLFTVPAVKQIEGKLA